MSMINWSKNLLISSLLFLLLGCQGELYNNSELFEATFGEASSTGCTTNAITGFHKGNGTSSSPFEICDKQQFINLAIKMNQLSTYASVANAHFLLTANLDMNGPEEVTYPIGYFADATLGDRVAPNDKPFNGVFNGGNFYIDNIVMNLSNKNYVGLFQHLGAAAIVKNLRLRGMITVQNTSYYVGSVAGYSEGQIENVISYMTLNLETTSYAGGLIGYQKNNEIKDSEYRGFLKVNSTGDHTGGIVGGTRGVELNNVLNVADIQGRKYVGGIAGSAEEIIADMLSSQKVVAATGNYAGGIIGRLYNNSVITNVTARSRVVSTGNYAGGIVGIIENSNISQSTVTCLSFIPNVECDVQGGHYVGAVAGACLAGSVFDQVDTDERTVIASGNGAALGCAYNEGLIVTNSNLEGRVSGGDQYVAGGVAYSTGSLEIESSTIDAVIFGSNTTLGTQNYFGMLAGFTSNTITVSDSEFLGSIGEHPVTLDVTCHDNSGGLVGEMANQLTVTDVDVNLNVNCSGSNIGGLVGNSSSVLIINDVDVIGSLAGFYAVGGAIGTSIGDVSIDNSRFDMDIVATSYYAGGMIAYADASSASVLIRQSYFDGSIESASTSGGLVAYGFGDIQLVENWIGYNSSIEIVSLSESGGIAGHVYDGPFISDNHVRNLTMVSVGGSSPQYMGGLIGIATDIQLLRSSISVSIIQGNNYIAGIVAQLTNSAADMIKLSEVSVTGTGSYIAGGVSMLRASDLRNLQLGSPVLAKNNTIDQVVGGNYVAGGVALIATTSTISNSISTMDLISGGVLEGFVAQDTNMDSTAIDVFFDDTRATVSTSSNSLGVPVISDALTDQFNYTTFNFSLWVLPTYGISYPDLSL